MNIYQTFNWRSNEDVGLGEYWWSITCDLTSNQFWIFEGSISFLKDGIDRCRWCAYYNEKNICCPNNNFTFKWTCIYCIKSLRMIGLWCYWTITNSSRFINKCIVACEVFIAFDSPIYIHLWITTWTRYSNNF